MQLRHGSAQPTHGPPPSLVFGTSPTCVARAPVQLELASRVAAAAKRPVVAVLLTAVPLDISPLLANPKIGAVLHAGQPSVAVLGVGDVLFGRVSPAGRAIQTVYPATYANEVVAFLRLLLFSEETG